MHSEIELGFAATAHHESHFATYLLGTFGAILASDNRFFAQISQSFAHAACKWSPFFNEILNGIHPSTSIHQVVHN
jgi:hypothetical protein